jgi:hypothetical protein
LKDLYEEEEEARATGKKIPHPAHENIDKAPISAVTNLNGRTATEADEVSLAASSISSTGITEEEEAPPGAASNGTSAPNSSASQEQNTAPQHIKTHIRDEGRVTVTFGISASSEFQPVRNLGGWKVKALSKTYKKVASTAKLIQRGEFRVSISITFSHQF